MVRPLHTIAAEIESDWKNVNYAARPYLDAMKTLDSVNDHYGMESGRVLLTYFLSNASSWRGDVARRIKKELGSL